MKRAGLNIPDGYEVTGDFEFNGGFDPNANCYHIRCVLRPSLPEMTLWLLAFTRRYIRQSYVPQDIAVIGYDDIELGKLL